MKALILGLLLCLPLTGAYRPVTACQTDADKEFYCTCLLQHPDEDFCRNPDAPWPDCCLAAEKNSKVKTCGCCAKVHGTQRIDVSKRKTYHPDHHAYQYITEYQQ